MSPAGFPAAGCSWLPRPISSDSCTSVTATAPPTQYRAQIVTSSFQPPRQPSSDTRAEATQLLHVLPSLSPNPWGETARPPGAPGWHSRLSVRLLTSARVMILQFVSSIPASGSVPAKSLLGILSLLLSASPLLVLSLKINKLKKKNQNQTQTPTANNSQALLQTGWGSPAKARSALPRTASGAEAPWSSEAPRGRAQRPVEAALAAWVDGQTSLLAEAHQQSVDLAPQLPVKVEGGVSKGG